MATNKHLASLHSLQLHTVALRINLAGCIASCKCCCCCCCADALWSRLLPLGAAWPAVSLVSYLLLTPLLPGALRGAICDAHCTAVNPPYRFTVATRLLSRGWSQRSTRHAAALKRSHRRWRRWAGLGGRESALVSAEAACRCSSCVALLTTCTCM
jgi:hypothetical protein